MKKNLKILHLVLCIVTLLLLFGCGTSPVGASASADAQPTTYLYDGSIISGMLDKIMASSGTIEAVPVQITSARFVRQGCLIHYDKIEYNDNYVRGSIDPKEAYFLNEEELDEQVTVSSAYLDCPKVASPYLDERFVEYIDSKEDGVPFTLYWLDGEVIFVSIIKTP